MKKPEDRYVINSVVRAARILESFTMETPILTNADLAKKIGVDKSTITRLMQSLEKVEFVTRDQVSGQYSLTHKLFQIGNVYVQNTDLNNEGRPLLEKLSDTFNENAQMGVLDKTEVLYLEQVRCSQHIKLMSFVGSRLPAYCTGAGKLLLAHLSDEEYYKFCRSVEFISHTPKTIVEPEILKDQLSIIRDNGFAIAKSEFREDVFSIAAPVLDGNNRVIAAISLAGPLFRMDHPEKIKEYIKAVVETAEDLSIRLGYTGKGGYNQTDIKALISSTDKNTPLSKNFSIP